ncbi:DUF2393 family protein [Helicobacter trogontum]|uniref:DUF2393 domain-containing protein n=1 Tax=Helicobacter trogontum TaxID=50960 RepID=A0A4U8TEV7_9HELI|nr:DUF2393 family protein [Helicobacter trogontum]TLD98204.1 DUF2393 domain-containing protein [Helicobacter trogontum]
MKEQILNFISYFHLYDLILFASFALIAMCFVFLSFISFRKKIISIPLFLLGFCFIVAIPFAMRYFMEERFYKIDKEIAYDRTYNYSDVYQYIATITNVGKRNIAGCVFSHQILYDTDNEQGMTKYKHIILNYIKPKKVYNRDIPMDLKVGQSVNISEVMENYAHKGEKYITKVECYGKVRHKEGAKVLQGFYKDDGKNGSGEDKASKQVADEAGKDDMRAYTDEIEQLENAKRSKEVVSQSQAMSVEDSLGDSNTRVETNNNINQDMESKDNQMQNNANVIPESNTSQSQGIPPQVVLPPQEEKIPPNWREERDRFNPPLLKEMPR